MEKQITDRYSSDILDQALGRFSIPQENCAALGGFESYIYEINRGGKEGILRISHSNRRSLELIRGELHWICYLKQGGVGAACPWRSDRGDWVEPIDDGHGGQFLASVFDKARGAVFREPYWPRPLLEKYGYQIGLMHKLSTTYQPPDPAWKRPEWNDPIHHDVEKFIPDQDQKIKQLFRETIRTIQSLPVEDDVYGLIHQDPHQGNFFVDQDGCLTFFDFDDCSYSWFVEDIALVLFYAVMGKEDAQDFTKEFLRGFIPGYFSAFTLDPDWFQYIPLFMKMRELDLYAVIHRSFDVDQLEDPWCIWFLDGRKDRLEQGVPYLEFDFQEFDFSQFRKPI